VKLCVLHTIFVWRIRLCSSWQAWMIIFLLWKLKVLLMDHFPSINKVYSLVVQEESNCKVVPAPSSIDESNILINASDASKSLDVIKVIGFAPYVMVIVILLSILIRNMDIPFLISPSIILMLLPVTHLRQNLLTTTLKACFLLLVLA